MIGDCTNLATPERMAGERRRTERINRDSAVADFIKSRSTVTPRSASTLASSTLTLTPSGINGARRGRKDGNDVDQMPPARWLSAPGKTKFIVHVCIFNQRPGFPAWAAAITTRKNRISCGSRRRSASGRLRAGRGCITVPFRIRTPLAGCIPQPMSLTRPEAGKPQLRSCGLQLGS